LRERAAGQTTLTTVDKIYNVSDSYVAIHDITSIDGGSSAGLHAVGVVGSNTALFPYTSEHWIVRKSAVGGSSWATVDDFCYSTAGSAGFGSHPLAVHGDAAGNVFVTGNAVLHTVTGSSKGKPI